MHNLAIAIEKNKSGSKIWKRYYVIDKSTNKVLRLYNNEDDAKAYVKFITDQHTLDL